MRSTVLLYNMAVLLVVVVFLQVVVVLHPIQ